MKQFLSVKAYTESINGVNTQKVGVVDKSIATLL